MKISDYGLSTYQGDIDLLGNDSGITKRFKLGPNLRAIFETDILPDGVPANMAVTDGSKEFRAITHVINPGNPGSSFISMDETDTTEGGAVFYRSLASTYPYGGDYCFTTRMASTAKANLTALIGNTSSVAAGGANVEQEPFVDGVDTPGTVTEIIGFQSALSEINPVTVSHAVDFLAKAKSMQTENRHSFLAELTAGPAAFMDGLALGQTVFNLGFCMLQLPSGAGSPESGIGFGDTLRLHGDGSNGLEITSTDDESSYFSVTAAGGNKLTFTCSFNTAARINTSVSGLNIGTVGVDAITIDADQLVTIYGQTCTQPDLTAVSIAGGSIWAAQGIRADGSLRVDGITSLYSDTYHYDNTYVYLRGDAATIGSVRMSSQAAGVMIIESNIAGNWTEIGRFQ